MASTRRHCCSRILVARPRNPLRRNGCNLKRMFHLTFAVLGKSFFWFSIFITNLANSIGIYIYRFHTHTHIYMIDACMYGFFTGEIIYWTSNGDMFFRLVSRVECMQPPGLFVFLFLVPFRALVLHKRFCAN